MYCVAGLDELARAIEIASDHRGDREPVEEHRTSVLVADRFEECEALFQKGLCADRIAGDVPRGGPAPQGVRTGGGRSTFGRTVPEQRLEPANALARIVRDPELIESGCEV